MRLTHARILTALALASCVTPLRAQDSHTTKALPIRIPFRFVSLNAPVKLTAADVAVLVDGQERPILTLEGGDPGSRPLELTLLFDTGMRIAASYSDDALKKARLDELPVTGVAVYGFENLLMPFCASTRDPRVLSEALRKVRSFMNENAGQYVDHPFHHATPPPGSTAIAESFFYGPTDKRDGSTAVYAAIRAALHDQASRSGDVQRALVVFGRSNPGMRRVKPAEISALARELGIYLYVVRLFAPRGSGNQETSDDEPLLALGPATGGGAFAPESITAAGLNDILNKVVDGLRSSYVAVFQPKPSGTPSSHRLLIRVRPGVPGTVVGGYREAVY